MYKSSPPRIMRAAIGLAAMSAFALAPMAAQAASADLAGTLTGGPLTNSAPALTAFSVDLTGVAQDVYTEVGAMNVTDATGSNAGYTIAVTASAPQVNGDPALAGTNGSITLTPQTATATTGNLNTRGPVATTGTPPALDPSPLNAYVIDTAALGTGQGSWDTTADTGSMGVGSTHVANNSLHVVIPADASAGTYASTLTFTSAPLA